MEGTIDRSMNNGTASYVFHLNSQNHHRIGSLIPVHGTENKIANRISAVIGDDRRDVVDMNIVIGAIFFFFQVFFPCIAQANE